MSKAINLLDGIALPFFQEPIMKKNNLAIMLGAALISLNSSYAHAQKVEQNAITSAEDAFGTQIGNESIGIYSSNSVRAFSPYQAGNNRVEGLYYSPVDGLSGLITSGSNVRVGFSSLGYAFPAPTGIADSNLKRAGDKPSTSIYSSTNSYGGKYGEINLALPINNMVGLTLGADLFSSHFGNGGSNNGWEVGSTFEYKPNSNNEFLAYYSFLYQNKGTNPMFYVPQDDVLPNKIKRRNYETPDWATFGGFSENSGLIYTGNLGVWTLKSGIFNSRSNFNNVYYNLMYVDAKGLGDKYTALIPYNSAQSLSGEAKLSRIFKFGKFDNLLVFMVRGRDTESKYGDADFRYISTGYMGAQDASTRPNYVRGKHTSDETKQVSGGISYSIKNGDLWNITAGIQTTSYKKDIIFEGGNIAKQNTKLFLPYFSAQYNLNKKWSAFVGYTEGLEESGSAPYYANNGGEVLPALQTKQYDTGLKYKPNSKFTAIFGLFHVEKPYLELDKNNYYSELGNEIHEGFEFSLNATPFESLTIVAGGTIMNPKITGTENFDTITGSRPYGLSKDVFSFYADYSPPNLKKISFNASINYWSNAPANAANSLWLDGSGAVDIGMKYKFDLGKNKAMLRLDVFNLFDTYWWNLSGSGRYSYNDPRRIRVAFVADF